MKRSILRHMLLLLAWPAVASSQPLDEYYDSRNWNFYVGAGVAQWQTLRDAEAASGGRFDAASFVLQTGVDRQIFDRGSSGLSAGIDAGLLSTSSNIPGRYTDLTSQAYWIGPTLTYRFGRLSAINLSLRGGLAYYGVDLVEIVEFENGGYSSFIEVNRPWSSTSVGASLGLRLAIPFSRGLYGNSLYFDLSGHSFDFGQPGPSGGTLDGPVWALQAGWGHRF